MVKDEMFNILKRLNMTYGNNKFPVNTEMVDVWHDILSDYDYETMQEATKRYILKSDFPPTIAGLVKEYDGIKEEEKDKKQKLNEWWDAIKSIYPGTCTSDGLKKAKLFYDLFTLGDPDRGNALYTKVCVDIKKADREAAQGNHESDLPTLEEYMKEIASK